MPTSELQFMTARELNQALEKPAPKMPLQGSERFEALKALRTRVKGLIGANMISDAIVAEIVADIDTKLAAEYPDNLAPAE